jgi:hypothetical protein
MKREKGKKEKREEARDLTLARYSGRGWPQGRVRVFPSDMASQTSFPGRPSDTR